MSDSQPGSGRGRRGVLRGPAAAAVAAAVAVALAACGTTGTSGATPQAASTDPAVMAFAKKVDADLQKAQAQQTARPPTSGPKPVRGKTVVVVPCSMAAEGCARPARAMMEAIQAIGWTGLHIDGQGDPTKQAAAFRQAVANKADGVIALSIPPKQVAAPLAEANAAGVKTELFGATNEGNVYNAVASSDGPAVPNGYLVGEYAYQATNGHVKMVIIDDDEFTTPPAQEVGTRQFVDDCKKAGGDCDIVAKQNILVANLSTTVPQQAADLVRRNPTTNVVWVGYDAATTFVQTGLQQAGLTQKTIGVSFNCNEANVDVIRSGGWEKVCAGAALGWGGYAAVDQLNRLFSGQTTVEEEPVPQKLITKDNTPTGPYEGDFDYKAAYKQLWQVAP